MQLYALNVNSQFIDPKNNNPTLYKIAHKTATAKRTSRCSVFGTKQLSMVWFGWLSFRCLAGECSLTCQLSIFWTTTVLGSLCGHGLHLRGVEALPKRSRARLRIESQMKSNKQRHQNAIRMHRRIVARKRNESFAIKKERFHNASLKLKKLKYPFCKTVLPIPTDARYRPHSLGAYSTLAEAIVKLSDIALWTVLRSA